MTEVGGLLMRVERALGALADAATTVARSASRVLGDLATSWQSIATPIESQQSFSAQFAVIAAVFLLCWLAVTVVYVATRSLRAKCASDSLHPRSAISLLMVEASDRAALFVVAYAVIGLWFSTDSPQDRLAVGMLWASVRWWFLMLIVGAILRPGRPSLRLIPIGEKSARVAQAYAASLLALGIAIISLMPLFLSVGLPVPSAQFLAFLSGVVVAGGTVIGLLHVYHLERSKEKAGRSLIHLWLAFAPALTLALWVIWSVDVLLLDFAVYHTLVWSIGMVAFVYVVDAVLGLSLRAVGSSSVDGSAAASFPPSQLVVLQRLVRVAVAIIVAFILADEWFVGRFQVISTTTWTALQPSLITAAVSLFVGYTAWELLHHWTRQKLASLGSSVCPSDDDAASPTSRWSTAVPLLRLLLGIGIVVMSMLVALSQLGIDIGPLIAATSIFGLAISFGSQALVRDIVSGIFFLVDDAFRIGEYIDTGRLKGTVERISVRSVQLRHQNGQVHTIPFGQLTSTTNFSRDWATIKFNIRLARDTDIEKVRKVLKRVGEDMLRDPELGPEFLVPLKLQGIADVIDNALVCRVKFTARPVKPTWVQRQALKRIHHAFKESGIEFASNAVTVQATGPAGSLASAAAAGVGAHRGLASIES
jgi:moderate conductance mechanosensitive channel